MDNNEEPVQAPQSLSFQSWGSVQAFVSGSAVQLGGTVDAFTFKVKDIQTKVKALEESISDSVLIPKVQEIVRGIKEIKELVPRLEESQNSLKKVETFLSENANFLMDLISANGRINGLEGQVKSIGTRLDVLEKTRDRNWDKNIAIISTIFAFLAAGIAFYSAFYK